MLAVIAIGVVCLTMSVFYLPVNNLTIQCLIFCAFTFAVSSRITIQIPQLNNSHIAVSDVFVFLALFLYGGEIAIILSAIDAFFSSYKFCRKRITLAFNMAAAAVSTASVVVVLRVLNLGTPQSLHTNEISNFIIALSVIALTQFVANSGLVAIYVSLNSDRAIWETWKEHYLWSSISYFAGAIGAGILIKLVDEIGFGVLIATAPVIVFVYFSYRMYLKNIEMSLSQAEQAKNHASILEQQSIALRDSEERFRSAFNNAPIGIALVSPEGKWLKVNRALQEILGYSEEEFLEKNFQDMLHPDDLGETLIKIHEIYSERAQSCLVEQRYLNKNHEIVWVAWSVSIVSKNGLERPNLIFQLQNISDKKIAEDKLQYEATHDSLTGLPNRALLMTRLAKALKKAALDSELQVSVLFIDLDRFKVVNDSLGHQIGDRLLVDISRRLRDCLRPNDLVARLGGDEFTVVVEGKNNEREVLAIAERIKEKFAKPFNLDGNEVYSSASIGILNTTKDHQKPEDVIRDADIAMYQAKRLGKSRHEVFDKKLHDGIKETLKFENDLRRAVKHKEFIVFYQPIYSIENEKIEGFEALARWNHKKLGAIPPDKFIKLAEEIGLINELGEQILRMACQEGVSLKQAFHDSPNFSISVNLSCRQFEQPNLVEKIEQIIAETGFSASNLKLEITESVFLEHRERATEMLNELCVLGVRICIDDFGTGYSNLNYLAQLPISTLKIDRSFITPIEIDGQNITIVQTILTLAQSLGMKVVAEGVETEFQLDQLKSLNCEGAQGYFFAKPMCFEEAISFVQNQSQSEPKFVSTVNGISQISVVQ